MLTPRDYQENAIKSAIDYLKGQPHNPLVVAPVGAGKSLIAAEIAKRLFQENDRTRILILAHVKELLLQNEAALKKQLPTAQTSFYCASLNEKKAHAPFVFASIQSIGKKAYGIPVFDYAIIDECHLISPNAQTTYQKFIGEMTLRNPDFKVIGLTGTPYRADTGRIDEGEGRLFHEVCYDISMIELIESGYLVPVNTPKTLTQFDASGLKIDSRTKDYREKDLQELTSDQVKNESAVQEIVNYGTNRKKWLIFTSGIAHCEQVLKIVKSNGIKVDMITGNTPKRMRDRIIKQYKEGDLQCLVNVAVLTTGFNNPAIDLIAFIRPTRSPVLYVQCVGRGMRTIGANIYDSIAAGKQDCLLLDFGGVVKDLGPIDQVNVKKKKKDGDGDAPIKQCPECFEFLHAAVRFCTNCDFEFVYELNVQKESDKEVAALSTFIDEPFTVDVDHVYYDLHKKKGKTPSMKVTYICGGESYMEWVCFEHSGYARTKAIEWHKERIIANTEIPDNAESAAVNAQNNQPYWYLEPESITVQKKGKYYTILSHHNLHEKKEKCENDIDFGVLF